MLSSRKSRRWSKPMFLLKASAKLLNERLVFQLHHPLPHPLSTASPGLERSLSIRGLGQHQPRRALLQALAVLWPRCRREPALLRTTGPTRPCTGQLQVALQRQLLEGRDRQREGEEESKSWEAPEYVNQASERMHYPPNSCICVLQTEAEGLCNRRCASGLEKFGLQSDEKARRCGIDSAALTSRKGTCRWLRTNAASAGCAALVI